MNAPARYAVQGVLYAAFVAFVGYIANAPTYQALAPGDALVRLSFSHGAQRKEPCRKRTAEELAKLSPNMRAPLDCPRERASVVVELEMDGQLLYRIVAPPTGLANLLISVNPTRRPCGWGMLPYMRKRKPPCPALKSISSALPAPRSMLRSAT